jgi:hypothetical protein
MEGIYGVFMDEFEFLDEAQEALYYDYPDIPAEELFIVEEYGCWVIYWEEY